MHVPLEKLPVRLLSDNFKSSREESLKIEKGMVPVKKFYVAITSPILQDSLTPMEFLLQIKKHIHKQLILSLRSYHF